MEEITLAMLISTSSSQDQLLEICQFLFKLFYFIIINIIMSWCVCVRACVQACKCALATVCIWKLQNNFQESMLPSQHGIWVSNSGHKVYNTSTFTSHLKHSPHFFISASTQPKSQPKDAFWEIHRGFHLRKQMAHQSCVQMAGLNPVL